MITKLTLRVLLAVTLLGGLPVFADLVVPIGPPRLTGSWSQTFDLVGLAQVDKFTVSRVSGPATLFRGPAFDDFSNGFANWTVTPAGNTNSATATSNLGSIAAPLQFSLHFTPSNALTTNFSFNFTAFDGPTTKTTLATWNTLSGWSFSPSGNGIGLPEPSTVVLRAGWFAGLGLLLVRRRRLHNAA